MSRYIFKCFGVALTALLATSCNNEFVDDAGSDTYTDVVCFGASATSGSADGITRAEDAGTILKMMSNDSSDSLYLSSSVSDFDEPLTRGAKVSSVDGISAFNVLSYAHPATDANTTKIYFNQKYSKSGTSFQGARNYYWPGNGWTLDFYASTATDADIDATNPSFEYTVPSDIASQQDILVSKVTGVAGDNNRVQSLDFQHICTAIQFVVNNIPSGSTITAIRLKGIQNSGTYSFASNAWTLGTATTDYELTGSFTADSSITPDTNSFMMLPQSFATTSDAKVEVILSETGKADKSYTASLSGTTWAQGKVVKYAIDIDADYKFEFSDLTDVVDAHYVIVKAAIGSDNFLDGKDWSVTVDNNATILYSDDANDYIKDGYWTDRYLGTNGGDEGSARGTNEITGSDTKKNGKEIYILIPENTGSESRTITLTIKIRGKKFTTRTITQLAAVDGWEQIDEGDEAEFGFNWNRKANLIYPYDYTVGFSKEKTYKNYCQSIIDDNDANTIASVENFSVGLTSSSLVRRYYIAINYNNLVGTKLITSDINYNGLGNTKRLKENAGTTVTKSFEDVLLSIKKVEEGKTNESAFRYPKSDDGNYRPADATGDIITTSAAIGKCLKKNKYNIKKNVSDSGETGYSPTLSTEDLVWYMPAVDEFSSAPTNVRDAINKSEYWSSSLKGGTETMVYLGDGSTAERSDTHKIRAKRQ